MIVKAGGSRGITEFPREAIRGIDGNEIPTLDDILATTNRIAPDQLPDTLTAVFLTIITEKDARFKSAYLMLLAAMATRLAEL